MAVTSPVPEQLRLVGHNDQHPFLGQSRQQIQHVIPNRPVQASCWFIEQQDFSSTQQLNGEMTEEMGVEVIDVRVKKIDLPPEVSSAVYDRMNSEREIEAQQHRATGRELELGIRADAERQVVVIEAEAYREAEQLRGDGDARAANIYASAYGADPEFYEFYRSINAYSNVFREKGDMLILDPNSEFFKYLKSGEGAR